MACPGMPRLGFGSDLSILQLHQDAQDGQGAPSPSLTDQALETEWGALPRGRQGLLLLSPPPSFLKINAYIHNSFRGNL